MIQFEIRNAGKDGWVLVDNYTRVNELQPDLIEADDYGVAGGHESDYEECPACLNRDAVVEKCLVCKGSGYV